MIGMLSSLVWDKKQKTKEQSFIFHTFKERCWKNKAGFNSVWTPASILKRNTDVRRSF